MIKAKLIKLQTLPDKSEKNMYVKSGDVFKGFFYSWPQVGRSFELLNFGSANLLNGVEMTAELRTTEVRELISDREFKTLNSIYKIVTWEDERDEKIKIILD